jgi:hypothetical protein
MRFARRSPVRSVGSPGLAIRFQDLVEGFDLPAHGTPVEFFDCPGTRTMASETVRLPTNKSLLSTAGRTMHQLDKNHPPVIQVARSSHAPFRVVKRASDHSTHAIFMTPALQPSVRTLARQRPAASQTSQACLSRTNAWSPLEHPPSMVQRTLQGYQSN